MDTSDHTRVGAVDVDLVEYIVLAVPHIGALDTVVPAVLALGETAAVRLLDLVVVTLDEDGRTDVVDADSIGAAAAIDSATCCPGALLSRHDIELISLALEPGSVAVVLLVEDRWAGRLSAAARSVGGGVRAGERVARDRMEEALIRAMGVQQVAV